jgi:hypothetical protein
MTMRISPDKDQPSASIEIPLHTPLPDYDLEQLEQPTPREVDAILVSQGFRDLVDDVRGILMELLAKPNEHAGPGTAPVAAGDAGHHKFELTQLTGAICPDADEVYRPGLWIVLRDLSTQRGQSLPPAALNRVSSIANALVERLHLA